ncbi:MAG: zinc ABC transporter substrate-binding protein [Chloroflexi bacterium]|nr:zinc ABC transporter substrate-binding protein [Chloroflexota bacterium]MCI0890167.1 zinc ABC transporter substrate-binding protein [Chloroflexota bacterium]
MTVRSWRLLRHSIIPVLLVAMAAVLACGDGDEPAESEGIRVLASLEIFADMVRNVGGERVTVESLLPSGADVHTYELPPSRVADVVRADIIFLNGLDLEEQAGKIARTNASGPVIELTEALAVRDGNPHLWLDVRLAAGYVERIRDELTIIDPDGRTVYEANAAAYLAELASLDLEMERAIETIPAEDRRLVTFHDAYLYLAQRYGLEVIAVVVPSPGQEPSARDIGKLSDTIEGVPAVFKEPQFNAEVLELVAEEQGVRVLDLLSDAYVDGVGTFVQLMRFNMNQLVEGLGGD